MTMPDWVVIGSAVAGIFGTGGLGVLAGRAIDWRKVGIERAKVDAKVLADTEAAKVAEKSSRETMLVDGMGKLISTLQATLDTRTRGEDAARAAHSECVAEVQKATALAGEAMGRIDGLEAMQEETRASLLACEERDQESQRLHARAARERDTAAEEVRTLRVKIGQLERRSSDPKIPTQR